MKVIISEKQLASLIGKKINVDEQDDTTTATPLSSSSSSSTGGESPGAEGKGAMDFPAYPEVDKAEDLVKRGVGNPVDYSKKRYEDYPEANPVRSRGNPIKGM